MPVRQLRDRQPVAADVLLAVGQRRAIRPDRRGHPPQTADLVAGGLRQLDAAPQQPGGVVSPDSALGEPVKGRLIAGGGRDGRARAEERAVYGDNLLRRVDQQPCRPQIVRQIVAAGLQFGRQATIGDQDGIVGRSEHHVANSTAKRRLLFAQAHFGRRGLGPITAATRQGHSGGSGGLRGESGDMLARTQINTTDAIRLYRSHRAGTYG